MRTLGQTRSVRYGGGVWLRARRPVCHRQCAAHGHRPSVCNRYHSLAPRQGAWARCRMHRLQRRGSSTGAARAYRRAGPDRVLDAVGVDAVCPHHGPAAHKAQQQSKQFEEQVRELALQAKPMGDNWRPGDAPSQALEWAVQSVCKAGTFSISGGRVANGGIGTPFCEVRLSDCKESTSGPLLDVSISYTSSYTSAETIR